MGDKQHEKGLHSTGTGFFSKCTAYPVIFKWSYRAQKGGALGVGLPDGAGNLQVSCGHSPSCSKVQ